MHPVSRLPIDLRRWNIFQMLWIVFGVIAAAATPLKETQALANDFRDRSGFSGVWRVVVDGKDEFQTAMGFSNEENKVEMKVNNVFPIGSNTKLLTAVAAYQLQERDLLDISKPVNELLDADDFQAFGFPNITSWCPKLNGDDLNCQQITMLHLLSMSSGIVNALNCDNIPKDSPLCHPLGGEEFLLYRNSIAPYVGMFITSPLVFKPGTKYSYSNPNFILATYLIEKISQQSFSDYLQQHIFTPLQMKTARFDPYDGQYGIIPFYTDQYYKHFVADKLIATGSCRAYWNSGSVSGTGGAVATADDLITLYRDLFENKGKASKILRQDSIRAMVQRYTRIPDTPGGVFFAQGTTVQYIEGNNSDWPDDILYCGGTACSFTCIGIHGSIVVAAFSNNAHLTFDSTESFHKYSSRRNPAEIIFRDLVKTSDGHASEIRMRLLQLWATAE